jgi:hypothetical protein
LKLKRQPHVLNTLLLRIEEGASLESMAILAGVSGGELSRLLTTHKYGRSKGKQISDAMSSRVQQQQQALDKATQQQQAQQQAQQQQQSVHTNTVNSSTAPSVKSKQKEKKKTKQTKHIDTDQSSNAAAGTVTVTASTNTASQDKCAITDADTVVDADATTIQAIPNSVYVCEVTGEVILYKTGFGSGLGLMSYFDSNDICSQTNTNICEQCGDATIAHRLLFQTQTTSDTSTIVTHDAACCGLQHSSGLTLLSVHCCIKCKTSHSTLQTCCSDRCTDSTDDASTNESSITDTPVVANELIAAATDSCSGEANSDDAADKSSIHDTTASAVPTEIEHIAQQQDTVLSKLSTSEYSVVQALILGSKGDDIAAINIFDSPQKRR